MWGKPVVKLKCSNCEKNTEVDIPDEVKCAHCNETLKLKGSFIKGLGAKAAIATILVGGTVAAQVDGIPFFDDYPSSVQYAIINTCIAGDQNSYFSKAELKQKEKICTCAFDNARDEIGYEMFQNDSSSFIQTLRKEIQQCD